MNNTINQTPATPTQTEKPILQKWQSEAGPRQTASVDKAIRAALYAGTGTCILSNYYNTGTGELTKSQTVQTTFGSQTPEETEHKNETIRLLNVINKQHGGILTRDNCRMVESAALALIPEREEARPTRDERKTLEAWKEEIKERNEREAQRNQERAIQQEKNEQTAKIAADELDSNPLYSMLEKATDSKKSGYALAASNIKKELNRDFPTVSFSVKSDSFSMGNSVEVSWTNGPTSKQVDDIIGKYEYGRFDGMQDLYESKAPAERMFSNIYGSTKYASSSRHIEPELLKAIEADYKKDHATGLSDRFPAWQVEQYINREVNSLFSKADLTGKGAYIGIVDLKEGEGFPRCPELALKFEELTPTPAPTDSSPGTCSHCGSTSTERHNKPGGGEELLCKKCGLYTDFQAANPSGCTIEEHTHTKKGFQMWLVILTARVDRDEFTALRDQAKDLGGWYSRAWGQTPAGFAFKDADKAKDFAGTLSGPAGPTGTGPTGTPTPTTPPSRAKADRLRTMGEKMEQEADSKRAPMTQNATPKRTLQYKSRLIDADNIERAGRAMLAAADALEIGTFPGRVPSKADFLRFTRTRLDTSRGMYEITDTGEYSNETPEARLIQSLLETAKTPEQAEEEEARKKQTDIESKILAFAGCKIPGFFVTHSEASARVIEEANIQEGDSVLEPEAGTGNLADLAAPLCARLVCVEIRPALAEILRLKGHTTANEDFLTWADCLQYNEETGQTERPTFDKIVMNPPFEKGQDMDHTRKAHSLLKKDGRLVSLMSGGTLFRTDSKTEAFRNWLDDLGGTIEEMPEGSFAGAGEINQTQVSSCIVVIDKAD